MTGYESRKWMILVATIWIQAFTGTNFDFSAYSSELKAVLGISQVQLNYLATASDLGKALGWSSGLALMYMPLWSVMFVAAFMGLFGYGIQWLIILDFVTLPYFVVFFLCLLAGSSITWFNTVCFVLCIKNFPSNRPLALALTVSFNGVSAALYNLAAISLNPSSTHIYLLLNAFIPLFTSIVSLIPILRQPPVDPLPSDSIKHEQLIFVLLNFLAIITGFYLLFVHSNDLSTARVIFGGAILLLVLPLGIPGIIYARDWFQRKVFSSFTLQGSGFLLVDDDDLEFHREFLSRENSQISVTSYGVNGDGPTLTLSLTRFIRSSGDGDEGSCCGKMIGEDQLFMLGEEHKAEMLVKRVDFWLYYFAYFCGGTIGLVYSNNLGQIAQSLGHTSMTSTLITLYSSFSFFGRLLSAAPDFIRLKFYFARTGWLAIALVPTPIAFFLVAASGNEAALQAGTALIGLSSGFIFAAAVSITSELFGPNSVGVNHNILITNIPIGSLVYGFLAALIYDNNAAAAGFATFSIQMVNDSVVCMGRKCYFSTFIWWGCLAILGLVSSVLLFLRTRPAYERFEQNRRIS
ncbi:protein NUCLEAR FUSION DEFECTIVE 4-like [Solanum tuberosum]|uniref:protein NUCLEAR FUSION DEFECTIVE 4-like n=1 Tax=Solanum tuberosum TaxID=4113 RepID=UPI0003D2550F|nr:PREDICTED: protein NUCLEAR FUSION DEFECTIVE 4-like [Solanum tuberosum]